MIRTRATTTASIKHGQHSEDMCKTTAQRSTDRQGLVSAAPLDNDRKQWQQQPAATQHLQHQLYIYYLLFFINNNNTIQ